MTAYPSGTIAIGSGDLSRYPGFAVSLLHLEVPQGTPPPRWQVGLNVAANFNAIIRDFVGEWVWILGDDHVFAPDTLMRLLAHNVDVVVPVCVRSKPPFIPVIFHEPLPGDPQWKFPPWKWSQLPKEGGLHRIHVAGSAGMLIRRHVLEKIGDPWFEVGQQSPEQLNEDSYFCVKLARAGIPLHVDLDTWIGHIRPSALWPARTPKGEWTVELRYDQKMRFQLPPGAAEQGWDTYGG